MKKKHRNGNRICPNCFCKLIKYGHTKNGLQRGYCKNCKSFQNPNQKLAAIQKRKSGSRLFIKYALSTRPISDYQMSRPTFSKRTKGIKDCSIELPTDFEHHKVLYLDGLYVRDFCLLTVRSNEHIISGRFCEQESSYEGYELLRCILPPTYVVCDGMSGLKRAINQAGPNAKHQRCLFHVYLNIRQKLTLRPETKAGIELLHLGKELLNIKDVEEKRLWLNKGGAWGKLYETFISEQSINNETGELWWTHEKLRSAAGNLGNLILNNNLFYYLDDPDVQKTNNLTEGGINSPIRRLVNAHHGCSKKACKKIIELYLSKRSKYGSMIISKLYNKK